MSENTSTGSRRGFFSGLLTTLAFAAVVMVVLALTWIVASELATPAGQW